MSTLENKIKILKFETKWCKPCKAMNPVINRFKAENKDVEIIPIDAEDAANEDIVVRYNIRSYPTLLFLHNDLPMDTIVGTFTVNDIKKIIKRIL